MSAARGVITGALALTLLQVAVSRQQTAENVGAAGQLLAGVFRRLCDPTVALIPDRRTGDHSSTGD